VYDEPVAWKPDFAYREEPYFYVLPINFVQATVNPPGIILQQLSQAVQNYAFKLRRMTFSWRQGPTNTAPAQTLGVRLFDYQARQLMSDFVNANFLDFNARSNTGSFIFGPHSSFPAVPIIYPVNGQIRIDLTDMNATLAGSISDIQGTILFEGTNLIPCDAGSPDPSVIQPSDGGIELMSGKRVYPLPYIYTNNTFNYAANKQTFTSVSNFTIPVDGDSDFWITAVHNLKTVVPIPPS
jgi:hypothetical protein